MRFSNNWRSWLALSLRIALGLVFVYAAYVKLREPWVLFAGAIGDYNILPDWAVIPLARTLPWGELLLGLLLISGVFLRWTSTVASLMMLVFMTLIVRAFAKGMDISCGCFASGEPISWLTIARDGSLLIGSLALTWLSFTGRRGAKKKAEESQPVQPGASSEATI
jgi:uncharacterized membrane protein YphA (DoxX/SURF4 family)